MCLSLCLERNLKADKKCCYLLFSPLEPRFLAYQPNWSQAHSLLSNKKLSLRYALSVYISISIRFQRDRLNQVVTFFFQISLYVHVNRRSAADTWRLLRNGSMHSCWLTGQTGLWSKMQEGKSPLKFHRSIVWDFFQMILHMLTKPCLQKRQTCFNEKII